MMEYTTEYEQRKRDMKELWKDTFHDSDRYVDLVFDTYFTLENTFVRYHEKRLIAAMLTVSYEFQILTKEGKKEQLRGMYLCGLATHPDWRRRGIMAELMEEAEEAARHRGYDLTFLIPADDHLRKYYERHGYNTRAWRVPHMIKASDSLSEPLHIYSVKDFLQKGKSTFIEEVADWCHKLERDRKHDTIIHSRRDLLAAMIENENTIFITDCSFDPEYPILAKMLGVVFPEHPDEAGGAIRIVGEYIKAGDFLSDEKENEENVGKKEIANEIYDSILKRFSVEEIQILMPVASEPKERGAIPYAMLKPLNENANLIKSENSTIEISLMLD